MGQLKLWVVLIFSIQQVKDTAVPNPPNLGGVVQVQSSPEHRLEPLSGVSAEA
jgi:hypothetical protein